MSICELGISLRVKQHSYTEHKTMNEQINDVTIMRRLGVVILTMSAISLVLIATVIAISHTV
jgi:hypothetical protein